MQTVKYTGTGTPASKITKVGEVAFLLTDKGTLAFNVNHARGPAGHRRYEGETLNGGWFTSGREVVVREDSFEITIS